MAETLPVPHVRVTEMVLAYRSVPPGADQAAASAPVNPAAPGSMIAMDPAVRATLLDPWHGAAPSARAYWQTAGGPAEIPTADEQELAASLGAIWLLDGAAAADALVRQVDLACLWALAAASNDLPRRDNRDEDTWVPRDALLDVLSLHPRLLRRLDLERGRISFGMIIIRRGERPAWTDDALLNAAPLALAAFWLRAADAVTRALDAVRQRLADGLARVEIVALRLFATALDDARNALLRECLRFFQFEDSRGVIAALDSLVAPWAKAVDASGSTTASEIRNAALAPSPVELQLALGKLLPLAQALIDRKAALSRTPMHVNAPFPAGPNREYAAAQAAERKAKQTLGVAVGRLRHSFPVVLRMSAEQIVEAADADRVELGNILFAVLADVWHANRRLRKQLAQWGGPAHWDAAALGWPDLLLGEDLDQGNTERIWRAPKYIERALDQCYPDEVSLEHIAVRRVLDRHGRSPFAEIVSALVRDAVIFQSAHGVDEARAERAASRAGTQALGRKVAEEAGERIFRLLPVLNWLFAAEGIRRDIVAYQDKGDRFRCTLDPDDALEIYPPDLSALLVSIEVQLIFAAF